MKLFAVLIVMVFVFAVPAVGQKGGPYEYGKVWKSWSQSQRYLYLWGFDDGLGKAYLLYREECHAAVKISQEEERIAYKASEKILFHGAKIEVIRDVMTGLYKDTANIYIHFEDMRYIAKDKLQGKPIEKQLREARRLALEFYRLIQETEKTDK